MTKLKKVEIQGTIYEVTNVSVTTDRGSIPSVQLKVVGGNLAPGDETWELGYFNWYRRNVCIKILE